MRILIRTSKWATWARRLGRLSVPLVVLSVLLHRSRMITSDVFLVAVGVAGSVALLAVLAGLVALVRLWQSGDQGWGRAFQGLVLGLLSLLPFAWYGSLALRYPAVTDIATTDRGLMPLVFEPGMQTMPPPRTLSPAQVATTFPNVHRRSYPLGVAQTYTLAQRLAAEQGWDILAQRESETVSQLTGMIMTIPGWREEVVVRVSGGLTESVVDMRSASLNALHDFGSNGLRIESFMMAMDDAVTTLLRDNPNANQPVEEDAEPAPVTTN